MLLSALVRQATLASTMPALTACSVALGSRLSAGLFSAAGKGFSTKAQMEPGAVKAFQQDMVEASKLVGLAAAEAADGAQAFVEAVGGNKPYGTQPANSLAVAAALAAEKSAEAAAAAAEAAHLWTTLYQQASTIEKEYHYSEFSHGHATLHHSPSVGPAMPEREFVDLVNPVAPNRVHASSTCAAAIKGKAKDDSGYLAGA